MLKKAFHKQYKGIIWKLSPDRTGGSLVLEIRDSEKKQTFFSGISLPEGKLTFEAVRLQESWFCGLEDTAHGYAFLHGYLSESLPGHRGIFAIALEDGRIVWEDYNLVFGHAAKDGLVAWNYKSEPRRYQLVSPGDGNTIRTFGSAGEMEKHSPPLPSAPLHFPRRVSLDADWLAHLPEKALPDADLLEYKGTWILAFYMPAGQQKMDHYLYVIDRNRQLVHQDLLAGGILQPAMDTFFVMNDQLIYIRSKSEFLAYFL